MNKRDALRLRVGEGIQYGDHVQTQKCRFIRKGVVWSVGRDGTLQVEVLDEADQPTGRLESVFYPLVAWRYEFRNQILPNPHILK